MSGYFAGESVAVLLATTSDVRALTSLRWGFGMQQDCNASPGDAVQAASGLDFVKVFQRTEATHPAQHAWHGWTPAMIPTLAGGTRPQVR